MEPRVMLIGGWRAFRGLAQMLRKRARLIHLMRYAEY